MYHSVSHKVTGSMLLHISKLLVLPALAALTVIASQPAAARVMPVTSASFEVSAVVVASCQINTGTGAVTPANTTATCNGAAPGEIGGSLASDLSNPTPDEATAGSDTRAVTVTY